MSEKLNELKKATMASYLAKAGKVIRADTSIAASFDDDYYKHLRVANRHHPNMVTPGFEKDPEKLAHAERQMQVNADLRDQFKRSAKNRIKGIALAGRRLAKEEAEQINEVSRSVIAKVATARYNQAQDALKKKDFGGYVKKMGKAIKAGNATTPTTGWSPEEDKKNEEVTVSPQEKYRQIKEARVTRARGQKSTTTHHNYYVAHEDLEKGSKALAKAGIPHNVADHSKAPVDHSVLSVSHKHTENADAVLSKHGIDFGGR